MENVQITRIERRRLNKKQDKWKFLKIIKNIITTSICIILTFITLTSVTIMFKMATNPDKVPSILGYKVMTVLTGSMSPNIIPGDLVISKDVKDFTSIKNGTIITYMSKDKTLITHRITEIQDKSGIKMYKTKGDANPVEDVEMILQDQIQGIYYTKIPYLGSVATFAKTSTGITVIISIFILIIVGPEFKTYINNSVKQKRLRNN